MVAARAGLGSIVVRLWRVCTSLIMIMRVYSPSMVATRVGAGQVRVWLRRVHTGLGMVTRVVVPVAPEYFPPLISLGRKMGYKEKAMQEQTYM